MAKGLLVRWRRHVVFFVVTTHEPLRRERELDRQFTIDREQQGVQSAPSSLGAKEEVP